MPSFSPAFRPFSRVAVVIWALRVLVDISRKKDVIGKLLCESWVFCLLLDCQVHASACNACEWRTIKDGQIACYLEERGNSCG